MKSSNERFENFLDQARRGRPTAGSPAPYGLATAVVARWRSSNSSSTPLLILQLARWGMTCAVLMSAALFFTLNRDPQATPLMEMAGLLEDSANSE